MKILLLLHIAHSRNGPDQYKEPLKWLKVFDQDL